MRVLVTGGAGFIGSNVVDAYVAAGHDVMIVDNLTTGKKENLNSQARFVNLDICDAKLLKVVGEFSPDIINHHAAQIDVRKSVVDPCYNAQVNEIGTLNLLQAAIQAKVRKIIFSSTGGAIYGEVKEKNGAREDHLQEPISPYAITKRSVELYLHAYYVNFGLHYTVLRYGNVYGPRQDPLGEAGVIAIFCGKMRQGEEAVIFGNGEQLRDYVYVGDVARANLIALKKGDNRTYNIGTGTGVSVNQLFAHLQKMIKFKKKAVYKDSRAGELFRSVLCITKAKKELKWIPKVDIKSGLKKTLAWYE